MDKINSNAYDINGISTPLKSTKNDTSKINSSNDKENKYYDSNKKNYEEEKNKTDLPLRQSEPNYRNILQNKNFIPINTLSDKATEENINAYFSTSNNKNKSVAIPDDKKYDEYYPDNNKNINQSTQGRIILNNSGNLLVNDEKKEINDEKRKSSDKEDSLSNGLNLDEQNMKIDCEKIENEINKLNNIQKDDSINIKISKIIEENKNQNENRSSYRFSLKSDLYCYSEEEDDKKNRLSLNNYKDNIRLIKQNFCKEEDLKEKSKISNNEKIMIIENKEDKENKDKNQNQNQNNENINEEKTQNVQNENINKLMDVNVKIDKDLLQKVEYGIDESGNPFNIKSYFKEIKNNENKNNSNENKIKSPIAFIIPQEDKGKNYLIDLSGKIIPKMDDGYFNYQHDNIRILIKDFDVQHPSLRVFGTRKLESLTINEEEIEGLNEGRDKDKDKKEKAPLEVKKLTLPSKNKLLVHNTSFNILSQKQNNNNFIDMQKANLYRNLLKVNKTSPIILKDNNENMSVLSKEEQFSIWKRRYSPLTYDRDSINTKNSTKEMFYRKIPFNYSNEDSINLRQKNEDNNDNTLNRTSKILNKSATVNYFKNRSYINNSRIITNSNIKKINLNKSDFTSNLENAKSLYKESKNDNNESKATSPKEIKNITCTSSRINLYNYKKLNKKRNSFNQNYNYYNYNRLINLKGSMNKKIENQKQINFTNEKGKSINISKNNSNIFNESKIKKSQSSINIASTIDNISNNIKYIQNNIQKNLKKLAKSNSNEHIIIRNNNYISTISTTNSQSYMNYNTYNNEIAQSNRNNNYLENISINSNKNNFNKIMKTSINKNRGIITPSKKQYQCAILSKEVNDIISNYTNSNPPKGKMIKKTVKKIGIYDYTNEIANNTKKINSFLNGAKHKNKITLNNDKNLNQRYNHIIESNNTSVNKSNISQILNSKNIKNNESNSSNIHESNHFFNINNRERNIIINKEINNFNNNNISEVISPIQTKCNINFYQKNINKKDNISKINNYLTEPKKNSYFSNKNQQNNRLDIINQINSVNDINMIFNNNNFNSKYTSFNKKMKFNNVYFAPNNNGYNYTERSYSNKNKIN